MPSKVPLNGEVSFEKLAQTCGLHEQDVRRLVRFAMVYHRVFQEKRAGFVSHSAASRNLLENPQAMMGVGSMFSDGSYQAFAHVRSLQPLFDSSDCGIDPGSARKIPEF